MPNDKATREKLIECARKEFLEKGYMKASLRSICKNAGVTTGALYFFFQNKEDLLSAVVQGTLDELMDIVRPHLSMEIDTDAELALLGDASEDVRNAKEIVHYLYQHYDVVQILLTKSQGSAYETIVDRFVDIFEQHYDKLMEQISIKSGVKKPDKYILHWMSHMQIDAFIYLLTHVASEEEALGYIEQIVDYIVSGWAKTFFKK
ncbi:MAG: TetR/AcrR family transcriptional regulator [Coprococcus sp.]